MTISFASYRHGYTSLSDLVGKTFTHQVGHGPDLCQVIPERWKTDAEMTDAMTFAAPPSGDYDCDRAVWVLPQDRAYVSIYSEQVLILVDVGKYDKRCISYEIAVFLVFDGNTDHPKFVITNSDWASKSLELLTGDIQP